MRKKISLASNQQAVCHILTFNMISVWESLWWKELRHDSFDHSTASLRSDGLTSCQWLPHSHLAPALTLSSSVISQIGKQQSKAENLIVILIAEIDLYLTLAASDYNWKHDIMTIWDQVRDWLQRETEILAGSLPTLADTPPLMTAESADNSSHIGSQVTAITLYSQTGLSSLVSKHCTAQHREDSRYDRH